MKSTAALRDLVQSRIPQAQTREGVHWKAGLRWHTTEVVLRWSTAVVAGISGVSMIANSELLAGVFSIVTVGLASTNAALGPADRTAAHKAASTAFATIWRKLELSLKTDLADEEVSDERFDELRQLVELCDTAIAQHLADAPVVKLPARPYETPEQILQPRPQVKT